MTSFLRVSLASAFCIFSRFTLFDCFDLAFFFEGDKAVLEQLFLQAVEKSEGGAEFIRDDGNTAAIQKLRLGSPRSSGIN